LKNIDMLSLLKNELVVSCQAYPDETLFGSEIMSRFALTAKEGGAAAIRANSPADIAAIKAMVGLPIIGIWKERYPDSDVYITPTLKEAIAVAEAGADIVAIDATDSVRPNEERLEDILLYLRKHYSCMLMADVSTLNEGIRAEKLGFDIVSTTLSGYTPHSKAQDSPDFELISDLVEHVSIPVFAEGRIQTADQAIECLRRGAYAVVVGSAITRPQLITRRFVEAIQQSVTIG
jgi:N-acylglucosamine-6-phosphate 2-epimerase